MTDFEDEAKEKVDEVIQKYGRETVRSYVQQYGNWFKNGGSSQKNATLLFEYRALFVSLNPLVELPSRLYRGIGTDCSHPRPGEKVFYSYQYTPNSSWTQNSEIALGFCSGDGKGTVSDQPRRGCRGVVVTIILEKYINKGIVPLIWPWKMEWFLAVNEALVGRSIRGLNNYYNFRNEEEWILHFNKAVPVQCRFCLELKG